VRRWRRDRRPLGHGHPILERAALTHGDGPEPNQVANPLGKPYGAGDHIVVDLLVHILVVVDLFVILLVHTASDLRIHDVHLEPGADHHGDDHGDEDSDDGDDKPNDVSGVDDGTGILGRIRDDECTHLAVVAARRSRGCRLGRRSAGDEGTQDGGVAGRARGVRGRGRLVRPGPRS
jgi:hypothetical protein